MAQEEKIIDFPPELDVPWPYLQRNFGMTAESGNNTANVLLNFNERSERVYKINVGMSDLIQSSEDVFFRMFYDLEVLVSITRTGIALPYDCIALLYHCIIFPLH